MKAATRDKFGGGEVIKIEDVGMPLINDDEILVEVHATTVNRTDCANIRAKPIIMRLFVGVFKPRHRILGTDFAGVVTSIGKNVKSLNIGDRVFGFDDTILSSHAQYMKIKADKVEKIPKSISFEDAVASIEGSHYFINFVNKVNLKKGDNVLVNGGTGAIGSSAIQILKSRGARVVATGSNIEALDNLGADLSIDYREKDFINLDEKFDFVFDTVGKSSYFKCKNILKDKGIYISSELGFLGQNIFLSLFRSSKVKFPFPSNAKSSLIEVRKLLERGEFKPLIDRRYSLDEISKAYDYVEKGEKLGNVVIKVK